MVDSIQFAKKHATVRRSVLVSELERLAQMVLGEEGEFHVCLQGFESSEARPGLRLHVDGCVSVTCQRCLEPMVLEIASDRSFLLAGREQDLMDPGDEADDVESLLADSKLDAQALVEDEILLQIPMAPMHAQGLCTRPEWSGDAGKDSSAFGVLGALTNTRD